MTTRVIRSSANPPWPDAIPPVKVRGQSRAAFGGIPMKRSATIRSLALGFAAALSLSGFANAAEVRVMISGGLTAAFNALVPEFERQTGNKVITSYGPSMGTTTNAIPMRLDRGEP